MIVLLWLCLILFPPVIGSGILTIAYSKRNAYEITLSESFALGIIACTGISEVVHILGLFKDVSLGSGSRIWGIMLCVVGLAALTITILFCKNMKERMPILGNTYFGPSAIPFVFIGILFCQVLFLYCAKPLGIAGDITIETVQSFLTQDGIYRVMPLTGQVSESGIPLRYEILCLPTIYAMLCRIFGMDVQLVVCHIVPVVILFAAYLSYFFLSGVLFGREAYKKRYMFLAVVALIFLFADGGFASDGFGALHGGYLGTSVRNLILIPYTFAVALERQWWKGILCILAEACLVWTFWGMGVCTVIFIGIYVLSILDGRTGRLHGILQIFRDKEDLG